MPAQTCGIEGNECNEVMELKKTLHEDSIQRVLMLDPKWWALATPLLPRS